jgi:maltodextrin utilization protein YvdJ
LRRLLDQNRLVIPTKGFTKPLTDNLMRELSGFRIKKNPLSGRESFQSTTKHDDTVMSLALAVKNISNTRPVMENVFFGV